MEKRKSLDGACCPRGPAPGQSFWRECQRVNFLEHYPHIKSSNNHFYLVMVKHLHFGKQGDNASNLHNTSSLARMSNSSCESPIYLPAFPPSSLLMISFTQVLRRLPELLNKHASPSEVLLWTTVLVSWDLIGADWKTR